MLHPADADDELLEKQSRETRTRRSGPGGQHRNKVETAVVLHHLTSGITAEASERRSQPENRRMALKRLRVQLALQIRVLRPDECVPSQLWGLRCRSGRITVSEEHDDFARLLAEALDVIEACELDFPTAAEQLGCTPTQLTKLLSIEPRALAKINQQRVARNLKPLRAR
jgi:RF-1 domain